MTKPRPHRRGFLTTTAATAFAPIAMPAFARTRRPNDEIGVALLGVGGRCRHLVQSLVKVPETRIVAAADIYDVHLNAAKALADPSAFLSKDFRAVLDREDVDAVLIASPDHWHAPMTLAALDAGKDVYVEKPLTHTIEEGRPLIDARDRSGKIVQVGMQQRSMTHILEAAEIVKSGRLGEVHKVRLTWNRNADRVGKPESNIDPRQFDWKAFLGDAPDQPFDGYKAIGNWRWFWDFGGGLFTDLMVHFLDVAHWLLDLDHPTEAVSAGEFVTADGVWETPDTVQTVLHYPGPVQVHFAGTFCNARDGAMLELMGSDATLYIDRGRYEVHPERGRGEPSELVLGTGPRGADFYDKPDGELLHLTNWVDCLRSRAKPNAPVEAGVKAAAAAHLANRALRNGGVASWA